MYALYLVQQNSLIAQQSNSQALELLKGRINELDSTGNTPLTEAADQGKVETATFLINNKADVNIKNKDGDSPLIIATNKGNLNLVKLLVQNRADVNTKNKAGETPLIIATKAGNLDLVKLLVENKADVNATVKSSSWGKTPGLKGDTNTALDFAKSKNQTAVVDYLIQQGAKEYKSLVLRK